MTVLLAGGAACAQTPSVNNQPPPVTDLPQAPVPTLAVIQRSVTIQRYENALPLGLKFEEDTGASVPLSLDDAVQRGLDHNLQVVLSRGNELRVKGLQSTVANALLPSLTAQAQSNAQEIDLQALGFNVQSFAALGPQFSALGAISPIVKVDVTSAQLNVNQQLFNVPAYFLYRASQRAGDVATLSTRNVRGGVALAVSSQYLLLLSEAAQIETARALLEADQVQLRQARDRHDAGVGTNLDVLRAQVQFQAEQQTLISDEGQYSKDKIQLNRLMGAPAGQEFTLTDTVPYHELMEMPLADTVALAFTKRKDLLVLESQLEVAAKTAKAVRYERLPTLALTGYYGVIGETTGLYHGDFLAQGSLSVPIFKEAQFRGEREVATAQQAGLDQQIRSLRVTIEQQIRASLLDVESTSELVKVARSNVELSRSLLNDAEQRFAAGVDDNLPVVQAQAALAQAESRLIDTLYQFNTAKLGLARNVGVTETQYRTYLGP